MKCPLPIQGAHVVGILFGKSHHVTGRKWMGTRKWHNLLASLVAQIVKCLPTMQETQVQCLHQEDLLIFLKKEMATHSNTLAWNIPWTEEPGRLQSMGGIQWSWT